MKSIHESDGELAWLPLSTFRRDCELVSGSERFAEIEWQSAFQALATAQCADGVWAFRLEGFLFRQWVSIILPDTTEPMAVFQAQPSFNGVLDFGDRAYYWESNFWLTKWIWSTKDGTELIRMQRHLTLRTEGSLQISPDALANPDVPLLSLLGWYLIQIVTDVRFG